MFRVSNRNTRTRCEICSQLIIKIPERRQWAGFFEILKEGDIIKL